LVQCRKKGAGNYGNKSEGVAEGYTDDDIETTKQFRNAIAGLKAKSAIDKAKDGAGAKYYADGTKVTPQETARRAAKRKTHLTKEASSPAQQAAIAIAMKKAGKKPKDMEESDAYDKDVKPSNKPHDKDAAAKRAKLAALAARKKMTEGLMNKIKAIKRGVEAKSKADDHFDKAGDPKNANASKDLKKAVRYSNLLNKEETEIVTEAKKKSWKDMRKKTKNEEVPSKATVQKGDQLTGKREPIEINPELKDTAK
jgi:hypothetical protein